MLSFNHAAGPLAAMCAAAHQQHPADTWHCLQEQDVNPLYTLLGSKGLTTAADTSTAQQLQALHTENLQLKSVLKQEIEARQQLESQNAVLLEVLRCASLLTHNASSMC
jgi:hypothetical protein